MVSNAILLLSLDVESDRIFQIKVNWFIEIFDEILYGSQLQNSAVRPVFRQKTVYLNFSNNGLLFFFHTINIGL